MTHKLIWWGVAIALTTTQAAICALTLVGGRAAYEHDPLVGTITVLLAGLGWATSNIVFAVLLAETYKK